jgi:hypothetical protein
LAGRCPATGLWAECSALYRLERAGLAVRVDTARVREEPFVIPGLRLGIGGGELVLYLYADTTARAAVGRRLDPERFVPPDGAITHRGERVVIASVNLLGIMKVSNPRNREIIVNALLGGPPQPVSETPRP